ncbi:MAG: selenobiotic family peptide radical SAM maturase [Deltaproteobacteria bacterium]|nr:MAG: selenobiotic family peptide radical SAM maturase [Deltaproteobacteria bacterium]
MPCQENKKQIFQNEYPHCYRMICRFLPDWQRFSVEFAPELLTVVPWIADVAEIDRAWRQIQQRQEKGEEPAISPPKRLIVNPCLEIVEARWKGLPKLLAGKNVEPVEGHDYVAVYVAQAQERPVLCSLTDHQLLALKIVAEQLDIQKIAVEADTTVAVLDTLLERAVAEGLLLAPESKIRRREHFFTNPENTQEHSRYSVAEVFTLQWHLTQACDLHCLHCYDRNNSRCLSLEQAREVLQKFYGFCKRHHVSGQVSFTGGNPLLYPHFFTVYKEAVDLGFVTAILGNPVEEDILQKIVAIQAPAFFQVSLEGLEEHNDTIRGEGHFSRIMSFLDLLKRYNLYSMVMLTLTKANQDQVVELAMLLKNKVDLFTFNRLAMVGEGAALASAPREGYREFLEAYSRAARQHGHMAFKDNFFNLLRYEEGQNLFGGCTGFGCGAAFNFVSLLANGDVHACRKLPSRIGNILEQSLDDIYHSPQARQYRRGPSQCEGCSIRPACGGCLAVSYGFGLDIFRQKDPYCFVS